ncbi:hypothetical protein LSH36_748g02063 [Paralvinella palmiformis]|uniref:Uncharacterized protein n=1 Tax=Paralvinella palmiformis TaxID=53620 RepID=A0AAD9MT72_9ANNE|nr:hypothetical protein LSH36_748g02063 [Paralvinella palmiformis]
MPCTSGSVNIKLFGTVVTTILICCFIAIVSVKRQVTLPLCIWKPPKDDSLSCRRKAIDIILASQRNTSKDTEALDEAKKCWAASLVFYLSYPLDFGYGSHVITFLASTWITEGPILEMGSGWYSTPVAHRVAVIRGRSILTADTNYEWLRYFLVFSSTNHRLYYVGDDKRETDDQVQVVSSWDDIGGQSERWGMIFVDHAPGERRKVDIERLRNKADLLVIHDSQPKADRAYKSQKLLASFEHRTIVGPGWSGTYTDVVSDSRPDLISIVKVLCQWSIEILKPLKKN